jgi:hypothetical protein
MAVESENVERLMEWLADGSDARSAHSAAGALADKLAAVVFQGEQDWPKYSSQVDTYRDSLREWFAADSGREGPFVELTTADADAGMLIDWLLPVVLEWEQWAARDEAAGPPEEADDDGLPDAEQGRYSEPVWDDGYGLDYRLDHINNVYEWYDEVARTWKDQAWAELYAARRHDGAPSAPDTAPDVVPEGGAAAEWDEGWAMFYRVGPDGGYEFADALTPGEPSSGCGQVWLSHEQVLARSSHQPTAEPAHKGEGEAEVEGAGEAEGQGKDEVEYESQAETETEGQGESAAVAAARDQARAAVEAALEANSELRTAISPEEKATAIADLTAEIVGS